MFTELFAVGGAFLGMVLLAACSTPGRGGAEPEEERRRQDAESPHIPSRHRGAGDAGARQRHGEGRGRHPG